MIPATVGWGTIQKNLSIKGNPLKLRGTTYTTGIGTPGHLNGELFCRLAGIKAVHVPYRVVGQGVTDLLAGVVQLNASAAAILALCDGTLTRDQIIARILPRSKDDSFAVDVRDFLSAARRRGWIIEV